VSLNERPVVNDRGEREIAMAWMFEGRSNDADTGPEIGSQDDRREEDVLGPMQNSLYLDLADGTSVCLWKKRDMRKIRR